MASASHDSGTFWASAVSDRIDTREAMREAAETIRQARAASRPRGTGADVPPSLVLLFASSHHALSYAALGRWVQSELSPTTFLGASADGVIGQGRELEGREAISLTAAWLPDTRVAAHHFAAPPGDGTADAWASAMGVADGRPRACLVFADRTQCDVEDLLRSLDVVLPDSCKVGAVFGGGDQKPATLLLGERAHRSGALVCLLDGPVSLHAVVAQGCRPVGSPFIVTRARGNVVTELSAGKPTEVLRKLYEGLSARDLALFNKSLFIGVEMAAKSSHYQQGDFLIRNVLGIDPERGAMAVDWKPDAYQVLQFHLRDRETAAQDLSRKLRTLAFSDVAPHIRGALLFSHEGRGERLYGVPDHDSQAFARRVSPVSLSGCFCSGEIATVGARTFVHGCTSVYAVFGDRR